MDDMELPMGQWETECFWRDRHAELLQKHSDLLEKFCALAKSYGELAKQHNTMLERPICVMAMRSEAT